MFTVVAVDIVRVTPSVVLARGMVPTLATRAQDLAYLTDTMSNAVSNHNKTIDVFTFISPSCSRYATILIGCP